MTIAFDVDLTHIEKAAEAIVAARKSRENERLAVEEYCVDHDISCVADVFCLAVGLVERRKIERIYRVDNSLIFDSLNGIM